MNVLRSLSAHPALRPSTPGRWVPYLGALEVSIPVASFPVPLVFVEAPPSPASASAESSAGLGE